MCQNHASPALPYIEVGFGFLPRIDSDLSLYYAKMDEKQNRENLIKDIISEIFKERTNVFIPNNLIDILAEKILSNTDGLNDEQVVEYLGGNAQLNSKINKTIKLLQS